MRGRCCRPCRTVERKTRIQWNHLFLLHTEALKLNLVAFFWWHFILDFQQEQRFSLTDKIWPESFSAGTFDTSRTFNQPASAENIMWRCVPVQVAWRSCHHIALDLVLFSFSNLNSCFPSTPLQSCPSLFLFFRLSSLCRLTWKLVSFSAWLLTFSLLWSCQFYNLLNSFFAFRLWSKWWCQLFL